MSDPTNPARMQLAAGISKCPVSWCTLPLILSFYSRFSDAPSKAVALQKAQLSIIRGEIKIENNKIIGIGIVR